MTWTGTSKGSASDSTRPTAGQGLLPGRYFRLLLIGYFEGLDAERAIAWRAADSFALRHLYETGGMRRAYLRGHDNIRKRLLIHAGGFNLGLLMRQLIGVGTPRGLQGRLIAVLAALLVLTRSLWESGEASSMPNTTCVTA